MKKRFLNEKFRLYELTEKEVPKILKTTKENMTPIIKRAWGIEWKRDFENRFLNRLLSKGIVKIIYKGNKFIGYFWFTEREDENDIYIISMQLKKEYQGKGIGNKILEYLEEFALNCNRKYMTLCVQVTNKKAIKLYQKFGFKEFFREKGNIYMQKKLVN
ncbi:MAG: GNAT family N-acetyltransferase [Methanosarcinales archaeon]